MTDDKWVKVLWDSFMDSWEYFETDISRLESLQATYDNKVDDDRWQTVSQIPLPLAWASNESVLGPAMDYLFPAFPDAKLIPSDRMEVDVLDRVSWALHLTLTHRMNVRKQCHKAVKDCFKVGVGYNIIEPITLRPPARFEVSVGGNSINMMGRGGARRSMRCRYLSGGRVIVYPEGTDFNGDDRTPMAFVFDTYPENEFRALFSKQVRDGEAVDCSGDVEYMIRESRHNGITSANAYQLFYERLSGKPIFRPSKPNTPCVVPVLKCFTDHEEGRHTYLFVGSANRRIIFDQKGTFSTMRKPLIKWDAWADADRWYGMNMAEAGERIVWAKNTLFNGIMDLVNMSLNRPFAYDSSNGNDPPEWGPGHQTVGVNGEIGKAGDFLRPPGIDQSTMGMMDVVDGLDRDVTGQRDLTQRNYTRGGSQAFKELLTSTTGREQLRHSLLQTGGKQALVEQTILMLQTLEDMDLNFQRPAINAQTKDEYIEYFSVTPDDFRHHFNIQLDLEQKHRRASMDPNMRMMIYDRMLKSPNWDDWFAEEYLVDDPYDLMRGRKPKEVVRQQQEEREAAQLEAVRVGNERAASGGPEAPPSIAGATQGGAA